MQITEQQLLQILPNARRRAGVFVSAINRAAARFNITSRVRLAAFLAQVGHESGELTRLVENLNYRDATRIAQIFRWGFDANRNARVDPEEVRDAQRYVGRPEALANRAYANRMGNGPEASGDGWRYRGRGLIQLTGKANHAAASVDLGVDLVAHPELLEQPEHAAMAAARFWASRGLNELADQGDFEGITRRINGGLTGLAERRVLWERAKAVLS
ncbi:glycoside hydrolase family 19 protein [Pseudomonas sp. PDM13]|uniref:glycoside hydrolase family 19 protein n=1 Tax=Pseudomonas sp. PDM13 TaxID=2769255 RepID=UPI0021DFBB40|nr:glycoside hydrolase family 19 protein [Pseudomonas sp. PDM13]MCU9947485.1 glycoside hydrolase family 19 protein [Pseudomonas sp. PDM13]